MAPRTSSTSIMSLLRTIPERLPGFHKASKSRRSSKASNFSTTSSSSRRSDLSMSGKIHRVTMFKVEGSENQQKLIEAYKKLGQDQKKDGKPYICSLSAGPAQADPRAQGYTVVSETRFETMNDVKYYDESCEAHSALKSIAKSLPMAGPPMMICFEETASL